VSSATQLAHDLLVCSWIHSRQVAEIFNSWQALAAVQTTMCWTHCPASTPQRCTHLVVDPGSAALKDHPRLPLLLDYLHPCAKCRQQDPVEELHCRPPCHLLQQSVNNISRTGWACRYSQLLSCTFVLSLYTLRLPSLAKAHDRLYELRCTAVRRYKDALGVVHESMSAHDFGSMLSKRVLYLVLLGFPGVVQPGVEGPAQLVLRDTGGHLVVRPPACLAPDHGLHPSTRGIR
jgi:hypothetical protein